MHAEPVKVGVVSLGCAKNLVDSEVILGLLKEDGFEITADPAEAEVIVVNTCTFIQKASEEAIDTLLQMSEYKDKDKGRCRALIVAGCLSNRYGTQLLAEMPELDGVMGTADIRQVGEVIRAALAGERPVYLGDPSSFIYDHTMPRLLSSGGWTAYIKVAEGCSHRCAYCIIPSLRGAYRSRPSASILAEAERLLAARVKEIILIAQDTSRYGTDLYGESRFADLLAQLADLCGKDAWLRWLYAHPESISERIVEVMAEKPAICPYIALPLQHASRRVLRLMGRRGDGESYGRLVDNFRRLLPGVALRTTFIVGFPGETEEDFQELCAFVKEQRFNHVGVFTYSPEEGTSAASRPDQIDQEVKEDRYRRLMQIQRDIVRRHHRQLIGKPLELLVEKPLGRDQGRGQGIWAARSRYQAPDVDGITYLKGEGLQPGQIVKATVTGARVYDLYAEAGTREPGKGEREGKGEAERKEKKLASEERGSLKQGVKS